MPTKKPSEKSIEVKFREYAIAYGVLPIKLNLQGRRGMPDRMILMPHGRTLFIEFKKPGEEPDPLQEKTHKTMRQLGHMVYVCDSLRSAIKIFDKVYNAT